LCFFRYSRVQAKYIPLLPFLCYPLYEVVQKLLLDALTQSFSCAYEFRPPLDFYGPPNIYFCPPLFRAEHRLAFSPLPPLFNLFSFSDFTSCPWCCDRAFPAVLQILNNFLVLWRIPEKMGLRADVRDPVLFRFSSLVSPAQLDGFWRGQTN